MDPIEQSSAEREQSQRLAARFAVYWAEHRHLVEKLAAIEASTAWAVARRLSQLRRRLAPEGSLRQRCFRFCLRGLRLWRREGITAVARRFAGYTSFSRDPKGSATFPTRQLTLPGTSRPRSAKRNFASSSSAPEPTARLSPCAIAPATSSRRWRSSICKARS